MKKNLKRQIKEDEFVSGFEHVWQAGSAHAREVKIVLVAVAVLAIGAAALSYFRTQRDREVHEAMATAMETFRAPVASESPAGPNTPTPRFATPAEKYQKAQAEFEGIARKYGSGEMGTRARYYQALCKIELNQLDDADAILRDIASKSGGETLEPALARLAEADIARRRGQVDRATEGYKKIVDDPSTPVPRDHALMSLAQTLEEARRLNEAKAAYQRLVDEFPASTYVSDARKRVEFLQARG